jgi:carbon monoxide dehydrogenase subunit G
MRRHVTIRRPADEVWAVIADAGSIAEWFPSMATSSVDGTTRSITMSSGMAVTEEIVTCDDELRRFQYRMTGLPIVGFHLATIDVFDIDGDSLLAYSTEIEPAPLALVLGGAIGEAVEALRLQLEAAPTPI